LFPPHPLSKKCQRLLRVGGDLIVRIHVGLVVVALTMGGSLEAAVAQSYYPPPPDYYPPPPGYYPADDYDYPVPAPGPGRAPVPPGNVGSPTAAYPPGYAQPGYAQPGYGQSGYAQPYPAERQGYYGYPDQTAGAPRPPGGVGGDATGSISQYPPAAAPPNNGTVVAGLPPEDQPESSPAELPPQLHRQLVGYASAEPAGTIVIDTSHTFLYLILGGGKALRYGVGVGREGFTWSGSERISRMSEWPDWHPPKEMIERQPYLPRFMAGGEGNPMGARALYLGSTVYRIHGTNQPSTIGHFVSSGCIRLTNEDIQDLYGRVNVGTRVVVLPGSAPASVSAQGPITR
jgi:lipoprotein-anchoring transpeptidase ErfK/SrfK